MTWICLSRKGKDLGHANKIPLICVNNYPENLCLTKFDNMLTFNKINPKFFHFKPRYEQFLMDSGIPYVTKVRPSFLPFSLQSYLVFYSMALDLTILHLLDKHVLQHQRFPTHGHMYKLHGLPSNAPFDELLHSLDPTTNRIGDLK